MNRDQAMPALAPAKCRLAVLVPMLAGAMLFAIPHLSIESIRAVTISVIAPVMAVGLAARASIFWVGVIGACYLSQLVSRLVRPPV